MKNKYKKTVNSLQENLEDGLLFCDIWSRETGLLIDGYNQNPQYSALFGRISNNIEKALKDLGLPDFGKYQIIDLESDTLLFMVRLDEEYLLGGLVDKNIVNMGLLLNIAIPEVLKTYKEQ